MMLVCPNNSSSVWIRESGSRSPFRPTSSPAPRSVSEPFTRSESNRSPSRAPTMPCSTRRDSPSPRAESSGRAPSVNSSDAFWVGTRSGFPAATANSNDSPLPTNDLFCLLNCRPGISTRRCLPPIQELRSEGCYTMPAPNTALSASSPERTLVRVPGESKSGS